MAHVQAHDLGRALLQQQIGEAAGALAHVQAHAASHRQAALGQRAFELEPAARDEAQFGVVGDFDLRVLGHVFTGFARYHPALGPQPAHRFAFDQALCRRTGGHEAELNDSLVKAHEISKVRGGGRRATRHAACNSQ